MQSDNLQNQQASDELLRQWIRLCNEIIKHKKLKGDDDENSTNQ